MNTVFLRLEAPLQSWGLRAHWEERDSAAEPTKSGVIGLVGCALGLPRSSPRLRELSDGLRMGVRVDREGAMLIDYHTTGGGFYQDAGYDGSGGWTHADPYIGGVLSAELASEGRIKVKINGNTKLPETDVSYRRYLMDASFLVALRGDPALVAEVAAALQTPVYPVFLGRKACVPSLPVFAGVGEYPDLRGALLDWAEGSLRALAERSADPLRLIIESRPGEGRRQYDAVGAPAQRRFLPRYVAETYAQRAAAGPLNTLEG